MYLRQPRSFYVVAFTEIWERFGYYGVNALLVIFIAKALGYSDHYADILFGAFSALVFLLPTLGGYIGDRVLGTRRTLILGAFVLCIGYALLSIPIISHRFLYLPLAWIAVGNGLFKPNPCSLVAKIYENSHTNKDVAFTMFYMSINVGSLLSTALAPWFKAHYGYSSAYLLCFSGLILATANFIFHKKSLRHFGSAPDFEPLSYKRLSLVLAGTLCAIALCCELLQHITLLSGLLIVGTAVLSFIYVQMMTKADKQERRGMIIFILLFTEAIVFFVLYFQIHTSINLFALRNVTHTLLGLNVEPETFQALNPLSITLLSPAMAFVYSRFDNTNSDLTLPTKFTLGIILSGIAYLYLAFVCRYNHNGVISGNYLIIFSFLQSIGELLVSALGLSLTARYIPQRFMGFVMGLWFLSTSMAGILSGYIATFAAVPEHLIMQPTVTLLIYKDLFVKIGFSALLIATLLLLISYPLNRLVRRFDSRSKRSSRLII